MREYAPHLVLPGLGKKVIYVAVEVGGGLEVEEGRPGEVHQGVHQGRGRDLARPDIKNGIGIVALGENNVLLGMPGNDPAVGIRFQKRHWIERHLCRRFSAGFSAGGFRCGL